MFCRFKFFFTYHYFFNSKHQELLNPGLVNYAYFKTIQVKKKYLSIIKPLKCNFTAKSEQFFKHIAINEIH